MKALKWIKENKIFFVTFGMLMLVSLQYCLQKDPIHYIDNYYYPLYVINYDCGYCSRLLVGAICSLFFGETLEVAVIIRMLVCVYVFVCLILSIFINNYLKNTKYEPVGVYAFFMVISPVMLAFLRFLGTLDLFWMAFILASVWLVDKKGWRWLVPVFCVIALGIYELFVTTYLPVMAIIVFYQFVKKPNVSNFIYIAVCAVVVGAATVYFLVLGDSTMKMTSDEMIRFARSRLDAQGSGFNDDYLKSVFFWELPKVEQYDNNFLGYIKFNFEVYTKNDSSAIKSNIFFICSNIISALPYVYLISKSFKKAEKPLNKFIFLCSFSPIPFMLINILLSTDTDRFSVHFLLAILLLLIFFIKEKDACLSESYDEAIQKLGKNKTILAIIGISVARIVLSGVRF